MQKAPSFPPAPPFPPAKTLAWEDERDMYRLSRPTDASPSAAGKKTSGVPACFQENKRSASSPNRFPASGSCCGSGRDRLATDRTRPCVWSAFPLKKAERHSAARQKSSGKTALFPRKRQRVWFGTRSVSNRKCAMVSQQWPLGVGQDCSPLSAWPGSQQ